LRCPAIPWSCYAPQFDLLARAALTLTHAGLNTVLDSLANAVPLVTVPITTNSRDCRRVEWSGAGRSTPFAGLNAPRLRVIVRDVLQQPSHREAARRIGHAIVNAGVSREPPTSWKRSHQLELDAGAPKSTRLVTLLSRGPLPLFSTVCR